MILNIFVLSIVILLATFVFNKLTCGYTRSTTCLVGKTALVTGGNSGIGLQVVKILASRGCRVIIADVQNAEKSKNEIIQETGNKNIITKYLNLASLKSVREFCEDINKTEKQINILVNNAGVGAVLPIVSEDGLNSCMQINHYGPLLLTHLLLDLIKSSAPSRIVFTCSIATFTNANLKNKEDLNPTNYDKIDSYNFCMRIYGNSKLCSLICANDLANRLKGTGVTVNSVHPGVVRSPFLSNSLDYSTKNFVSSLMFFKYVYPYICHFFTKDIWEGSQTTAHVAIAKELENVTGQFFLDCKPFYFPPKTEDKQFGKMVIETSEEYIGLRKK